MLVVEGPDGAGKTTLIETLSERLNWPVAPRVVSQDTEAMVDLKAWVEENVRPSAPQRIIYDRHRLISEPIYGSVLRDRFEPGFDDVNWLGRVTGDWFEKLNPVVIFCLPPYENVLQNIQDDPHNIAVVGHIRKIYSLYVSTAAYYLAARPDNTYLYDYTKNPQVPSDPAVQLPFRKLYDV